VKTFSENDRQLQGTPGVITVLHTHSRRLDYHPHVHLVMPAAALDAEKKLWRSKKGNDNGPYLFHYKALAKVFRAKVLQGIEKAGLHVNAGCPATWVVDVKSVGSGEKALVYLGRYLYRGVVQEKDIIACDNGQVTFRYRDSKSKQTEKRTLPGADFLALILQHVLPKGFRRARQFGFLHPNSKRLIGLLQYLLGFDPKKALAQLKARPGLTCPCCGAPMVVMKTRLPAPNAPPLPIPIQQQLALSVM
jgi:hypothetical protein